MDSTVVVKKEFENLLIDVVVKIFSYLSLEERQELRYVSPAFRNIIDEAFGIKIRIKNSTSDLISSCPYAVDVELSSMTIPFEICRISFAETLQKLCFSKIIVTYNLVTFLKACSNITHLTFVNIILDQPISDPWSTSLLKQETVPMVHLKTLELKCFTFVEGVLEIFGFLNEKVTYGKLQEVIINVQNPPVIPLQILFARSYNPVTTHPLLQLLKKNRTTLRKFVMGRPGKPVLMKLYSSPYVPDLPSIEGEEPTPPQLEHLEIHPYFREEWSPILRGQTRIKIMDLGSCNVSRWGEIQEAISSNAGTLESFSIGGLSFGQNWNCSVFQNCFALKDLFIEISHSNKVNLNEIPRQLQRLHMFGPITRQEIISISENLFELETLKFTHLGKIAEFIDQNEDKMTLDVFKLLLQLPKLKVLSLFACSSISIDWDGISEWCEAIRDSTGFAYTERFYQLHGEYFRNGITVEISEGFRREDLSWSLADRTGGLKNLTSQVTNSTSSTL